MQLSATHTVKPCTQGTSIFLVGMMGSGKSTVGLTLANVLRYCFFDTDAVIEEARDCSISEIFANEGEDAFRDLEASVLRELAPHKSLVVATGGGAVLRCARGSRCRFWRYKSQLCICAGVGRSGKT